MGASSNVHGFCRDGAENVSWSRSALADARDREQSREPLQYPGEERDEAAEGDFHIGVDASGQCDAAARHRKLVVTHAMMAAHIRNATGAAAPRSCDTSAGMTKIPAPTVVLTIAAVS